MRIIYLVAGLITLILSYIGIILPGVPAIPFILLTLWFFMRSSNRLYNWLIAQSIINKLVGKSITGKEIKSGIILFTISQLWVSMFVALYLWIHDITWQITTVFATILLSSITYFLMKKNKP